MSDEKYYIDGNDAIVVKGFVTYEGNGREVSYHDYLKKIDAKRIESSRLFDEAKAKLAAIQNERSNQRKIVLAKLGLTEDEMELFLNG